MSPGEGSPPGGALGDGSRSEGCEGQREEEGVNGSEESGGREARLRLWRRAPGTQPRDASPGTPARPPALCSLQPNSSLRSGQSLSSSQWKLAEMHVFVETQRNCVGAHTSSGCLAAGGQRQAVWAEGSALRKDLLHFRPIRTAHPAHIPQVFPGLLSHLTHMTHGCPDTAATTLPMSRSPVGHQMAHHISLPSLLLPPMFLKTVIPGRSQSLSSSRQGWTFGHPQKHKAPVKGTATVASISGLWVIHRAVLYWKALARGWPQPRPCCCAFLSLAQGWLLT